jgi:aryl-alcohol dehydrogenase-like predicted oxidoreductase
MAKALSRLGLGCYPLGGGYGPVADDEAKATVDAALASGWTLLDTAEAYLESEARLGHILQGRRDGVFLATKVFPCQAYSFANMRRALDNSLRKLQTDRIDLYQLHGPQDWVTAFADSPSTEELADSLNRLLASGDILNVGVCNLPEPALQALNERVPLFSTQNLLSILDREGGDDGIHLAVEQEILPWARAHDVAFLAFSPLARGLLSDNLDPNRVFSPDDERYFLPRFSPEVYPDWVALAQRLQDWAKDHGHSLVHLAVAWTLSVPGVTSTLIGAKSPQQIEAIAGAESWVLSPQDLNEIEDLVATLPESAQAAKSIVWDHFPPSALAGMVEKRHGE